MFRSNLYRILDHWTEGFIFTFCDIPVKFSLSDVALILGVPNHRKLVDVEATTLDYMFDKFFKNKLSSR